MTATTNERSRDASLYKVAVALSEAYTLAEIENVRFPHIRIIGQGNVDHCRNAMSGLSAVRRLPRQ